MLRTVLMAAITVALSACAANPKTPDPFAPYQAAGAKGATYTQKKAYRLGQVRLTLDQTVVNAKFPDTAGLQDIFTAMLTERLEKKGYLAEAGQEALELDLDIHYRRVFTGEMFGVSRGFAASTFRYRSALKCGEVVCAHLASPELVVKQGMLGNLLKIGKTLSLTAGPEDELGELASYADAIVRDLPR